MIRNRWVVFVSFTILATISIGTRAHNTNSLLQHFQGLLKSANTLIHKDNAQIVQDATTSKDMIAVLKETKGIEFDEKPIELDGSLVPVASIPFNIPRSTSQHSEVRDKRQGACTCTIDLASIDLTCTITCSSTETRCGQTCTITTIFTDALDSFTGISYQNTEVSYGPDCPGLPCVTLTTISTTTVYSVSTSVETCSISYLVPFAPTVLRAVAGLAVGIGIGISITPTPVVENELVDISTIEPARIIGEETPVNNLDTPVLELRNFTADGCRNNSVRFNFGNCTPLLRRGSCPSPYQWVTAHPISLQVNKL